MLKNVVKKIIPRIVRVICGKYWIRYKLHKLKKKIITFLEAEPRENYDEKKEIVDFLKANPLCVFPYDFSKKYNVNDIIVHLDHDNGMKYVLHGNKRLYFKKKWNEYRVKRYYNTLLTEQDIDSPHRYELAGFCVNDGDIVVDVGVAEGNFALSIIEKVEKLYLFEVDEEWIEALKETFAPWKEKVEIVCKYVSDNDEGNCISLDSFLGGRGIDFIKADIEGAEIALLKGCQNILSDREQIKIAICTYHKQDDANKINNVLKEFRFNTEFSKRYMIFLSDKRLCAPYLRKGLIRAVKL